MSAQVELKLMRLLHGELTDDEARHWRRRIEVEPDLARRWAQLEPLWSGLELPQPAAADPALRRAVRARLRRPVDSGSSAWRLSPAWSRVAAAAALATGIGLGMVAAPQSLVSGDEALFNQVEPSLAESYWLAMTADEAEVEVQP
jgi:ferric-dicitrate binding protein FerR (iron transport regulator)